MKKNRKFRWGKKASLGAITLFYAFHNKVTTFSWLVRILFQKTISWWKKAREAFNPILYKHGGKNNNPENTTPQSSCNTKMNKIYWNFEATVQNMLYQKRSTRIKWYHLVQNYNLYSFQWNFLWIVATAVIREFQEVFERIFHRNYSHKMPVNVRDSAKILLHHRTSRNK